MENKQLINGLIQFIDVCSQRGVVRGDELSTVGSLRQMLVNILEEQKDSEKQDRVEE